MNRIRSAIGESNSEGQQRRFVVPSASEAARRSLAGGEQSSLAAGRSGYTATSEVEPQSQPPMMPGQEIDPAVATNMRRQAHEYQEQQEQRLLVDARRRIEIITGLGRKTKEVTLETPSGIVTFTLRTLKTFEQNCLSQVIEKSERLTTAEGRFIFAPSSLARIRVEALSHSLFLIDGQSIDIVLGTANAPYEQQVLARKDLIEEMDHALINHLFDNYESLTKETYDGYMPRTVEQAKEVVETISKSGEDA